jgi:hypothetical protein
MGMTAEKVAQQWGISRDAQDEFALNSHKKAIAAQQAGEFNDEITPFTVVKATPDLASGEIKTSTKEVKLDEGPRADSSIEGLTKLRPVFAAKGSVTAGNSSQMSDGAGALILASEEAVKRYNLTPLAKWRGFAVRGVPPEIMGIGPKEAIPAVLKTAGLKTSDIDWFELNEAFAAQSLAVMKDLELDPAKSEPHGRRNRLGSPAGCNWCNSCSHRGACTASPQPEIRYGNYVYRHRHGCSRHLRTRVISARIKAGVGANLHPFFLVLTTKTDREYGSGYSNRNQQWLDDHHDQSARTQELFHQRHVHRAGGCIS